MSSERRIISNTIKLGYELCLFLINNPCQFIFPVSLFLQKADKMLSKYLSCSKFTVDIV